jgi:hypothetical protein
VVARRKKLRRSITGAEGLSMRASRLWGRSPTL